MKKIINIFFILLVSFILTSCNKQQDKIQLQFENPRILCDKKINKCYVVEKHIGYTYRLREI